MADPAARLLFMFYIIDLNMEERGGGGCLPLVPNSGFLLIGSPPSARTINMSNRRRAAGLADRSSRASPHFYPSFPILPLLVPVLCATARARPTLRRGGLSPFSFFCLPILLFAIHSLFYFQVLEAKSRDRAGVFRQTHVLYTLLTWPLPRPYPLSTLTLLSYRNPAYIFDTNIFINLKKIAFLICEKLYF